MPFLDSLDVANRALQHLGAELIGSVDEDSTNNKNISFSYDKVRRAELNRNTWRFSIRNVVLRAVDRDTMILVPSLYDSTKTYLIGAIVRDTNGQLWQSMLSSNIDNTPGANNDSWDSYFGPLTVMAYDSTVGYYAGELVYKAGATAGSFSIYSSLENINTDVPSTTTAYDATVTYHAGEIVSYSGSQWRSRIEVNLGITPAEGPAAWDATVTYTLAQTVTGSDNFIYSAVGTTLGADPTTDGGVHWTNTNLAFAWTALPVIPASSGKWRVIDAAMQNLNFSYPIGSGPATQSGTLNVFRLPAGYLKVAPQDPKNGANPFLGAPSGNVYLDWNFQDNFIVSHDIGPIIFRFVADVTRVVQFTDMFCEGLACRVAIACCEGITQSTSKLTNVVSEYNKVMGEARLVNAIEIGATEPPEDDYITCRV